MGKSEPLGSPARGPGQATSPVNCKAGHSPHRVPGGATSQQPRRGHANCERAWPSSGPLSGLLAITLPTNIECLRNLLITPSPKGRKESIK